MYIYAAMELLKIENKMNFSRVHLFKNQIFKNEHIMNIRSML